MSLPLLLLFGFVSLLLLVEFIFYIRRMQVASGSLIKIGIVVGVLSVGTVLFLNRQTLISSSRQLADTNLPSVAPSPSIGPVPTEGPPSPTPVFISLLPETGSPAADIVSPSLTPPIRTISPTATPVRLGQAPTQKPSPTKRFTPTPRTNNPSPTIVLPRTGGGEEQVITPKLPVAGLFHPTILLVGIAVVIAVSGFLL